MKHRITLTQKITYEVDIEADTAQEAMTIAIEACDNGTIEDYGVTEKDGSQFKVEGMSL